MSQVRWIILALTAVIGTSSHAFSCRGLLTLGQATIANFRGQPFRQEGVPVGQQLIARDNPTDPDLIKRWDEREVFHGYSHGKLVDRWGNFDDDLKFIISLPNWRDLTNAEIRRWIALFETASLFNDHHSIAEALEMAAIMRESFAPTDIEMWNRRFPLTPIPEYRH